VVDEVEADGVTDVGEPRRPGVVVDRWLGGRPGAAQEQAACQDDQAARQDKQAGTYPGQPNGPHGCVPPREDELTDGAERVLLRRPNQSGAPFVVGATHAKLFASAPDDPFANAPPMLDYPRSSADQSVSGLE